MKTLLSTTPVIISLLVITLMTSFKPPIEKEDKRKPRFAFYEVNPKTQTLKLYWKDKEGQNYQNFQTLKTALETQNEKLVFAMNGGMYLKDLSPQGLFVENGKVVKGVNRKKNDYGNFYMEPNGVFYWNAKGEAHVQKTTSFQLTDEVIYATQSGPMLLIDGEIHSNFMFGSNNLHYRNGVGILPNGNVLFAISLEPVNFYDFAEFFRNMRCENALYLDGFVSRMYLPEKGRTHIDKSTFGVIIGVTE